MGKLLDKRMKGKANSNGFSANPDNINKKGRPKKTITNIISELKGEGYEVAHKEDIVSAYLMFVGLDEEKIKEIATDKSQPMLVRIVGKNLLSGKGFDILEKLLDRSIGKAKQEVEMIVTENNDNPLLGRLQELNKMKEKPKKTVVKTVKKTRGRPKKTK